MTIADSFLAEFEAEAVTTRKFLERLPEDKLTWTPHEKSMTAGQLALHLAASPGLLIEMARQDECPPPDFNQPNPQPASCQEILSALDKSIAGVREGLGNIDDQKMQGMWKIAADGREVMSMPRAALLRSVLLNHWYHHRGQFAVYLRLLGAAVPASYGPSRDEIPEWAGM